MKLCLWLIALFLTGCAIIPTPNDFPPPPPMTPIVEWPQATATAVIEPRLRPILSSDMQDAETFFLILKTSMAAGDDTGIAKLVKYPLHVKLGEENILFKDQHEFLDLYEKIFDNDFISSIFEIDESTLTLFPDGVRTGTGELWFNYFCTDLTCSDAQFLITQINK